MSFISLDFLVFFPLVVITYFLFPHRFRWIVLLSASCIFYMAFIPKYILVLFCTIVIDYFAGIFIEASSHRTRKTWLTLSIIANLSLLFVFKYYNFFLTNLQLDSFMPAIKWALPLGLSFHTFQAIAYTIEVYSGRQKAERHFGIYAVYILFFPQLVAGPIERPQHILPQFHEQKFFTEQNVTTGLRLILWGFFKKIVIADRLALFTDLVYSTPGNYSALALTIGTFFFAFQIYCDFSAYSDIAVGSAKVLGFELTRNFNFPYQSRTIADFWARWHISLSSWFRDYVYIPLGGNRVSLPRWCFNILFVFFLSGLWHGAGWTFIAWGILNGLFLLLEKATKKQRHLLKTMLNRSQRRFDNYLRTMVVFLLIMTGWVFFRANTIHDAITIFYKQRSLLSDVRSAIVNKSIVLPGLYNYNVLLSFLLIAGLYCAEVILERRPFHNFYLPAQRLVRWSVYYTIIALIVLIGVFYNKTFIYFQF